jgi:hypothetical protein
MEQNKIFFLTGQTIVAQNAKIQNLPEKITFHSFQ